MARSRDSKSTKKGSGSVSDPEEFLRDMIGRMEACPDAESLNDNVILPFALALEKVAGARGYLLNIYGEASNIAVTSEDDAETIYHLIEEYLDQRDD
ncbi:MAG: hypothetical protein RIC16_08420 [Rhodospirillales bacterium]